MPDRLFPRWCTAMFMLIPLCEVLYCPVDAQTGYAAAIACLLLAPLCAIAARLAPKLSQLRAATWLLALAALWPLVGSLSRMTMFVRQSAFPRRPLWLFALFITLTVLLLARCGLTRLAMWTLPVAALALLAILFSGAQTLTELRIAHFAAPDLSLLTQAGDFLRLLLPSALLLSCSLPEGLAASSARGMATGGALLALISLRTVLLLGPHTAALLPYPNFAAAGLASFGDFAKHGEVFFSSAFLLCELGRAAALACVVCLPFPHAFGIMKETKEKSA